MDYIPPEDLLVRFAAGATSSYCFSIDIQDDPVVEHEETFTVILMAPDGGGRGFSLDTAITIVHIIDRDGIILYSI